MQLYCSPPIYLVVPFTPRMRALHGLCFLLGPKVDPKYSPGVLLANATSAPMLNVTFDDVVVVNPPSDGAWGTAYYACEGVAGGVATGASWPVPPCFEDQTDAAKAAANAVASI